MKEVPKLKDVFPEDVKNKVKFLCQCVYDPKIVFSGSLSSSNILVSDCLQPHQGAISARWPAVYIHFSTNCQHHRQRHHHHHHHHTHSQYHHICKVVIIDFSSQSAVKVSFKKSRLEHEHLNNPEVRLKVGKFLKSFSS